MSPYKIAEIIYLVYSMGSLRGLKQVAGYPKLLKAAGPRYKEGVKYSSQAAVALAAFTSRAQSHSDLAGTGDCFVRILAILSVSNFDFPTLFIEHGSMDSFISKMRTTALPKDEAKKIELMALLRQWAETLARPNRELSRPFRELIKALSRWAHSIEHSLRGKPRGSSKPNPKASARRASKKKAKRK